jgi:hypothetical protein
MAIREQAQNRTVIDRGDGSQRAVAQGDDRCGTGVMRIGLVGPDGVEEPHPGRQGGRHVNDVLTGGDELLGKESAEPTGGLDRPAPVG